MPTQVVLELAGQSTETIELADDDAVLIGRDPDPARIGEPAEGMRRVRVTPPSVSATHLVVRRGGDTTALLDVRSRNGTWLRLPPGDRVEVRSSQPLQIRIAASPPVGAEPDEGPKDATWRDRSDFHLGVAAAIRAWFESLGVAVQVTTTPSPGPLRDSRFSGQLPLENDHHLHVLPMRTVDGAWNDRLAVLWRYVGAQNAIFASEEETREEGLILASPAIRQAHRQVVAAAQRGIRVLLIGPSGSGKEGLAKCYHRHSRRSGNFVGKNCSMLSREFLRAELFGAEKGAFTSAVTRIVGAVEAAHGGTLFLDEIGELSSDVQPALLKFLDSGEYERMGSYNMPRSADVRLVCATNKDLRAATLRGEFRDDLWYRIAGQVIQVPPLRDRPEDIEAYLRAQSRDREVDPWTALDGEARRLVLGHEWAGNFRELAAFAIRFPRAAASESIGAAASQELLDAVALAPRMTPRNVQPAVPQKLDMTRLSGDAARHYSADFGHELRRWDDVKEWIENYFKPLLFAELSGASVLARREEAVIAVLAEAIDADRGTVLKQLNRYFERFRK